MTPGERPEAQVNLANLYLARGKADEAEATLLKAIEIDPTFVPAPIALSELRRAQGQESAAEATLRSALKQNPESAPLLHALGLSLVRHKRTEEAVEKQPSWRPKRPGSPTWPVWRYTIAANQAKRQKSFRPRCPIIPMIAKSSTPLPLTKGRPVSLNPHCRVPACCMSSSPKTNRSINF